MAGTWFRYGSAVALASRSLPFLVFDYMADSDRLIGAQCVGTRSLALDRRFHCVFRTTVSLGKKSGPFQFSRVGQPSYPSCKAKDLRNYNGLLKIRCSISEDQVASFSWRQKNQNSRWPDFGTHIAKIVTSLQLSGP